MKQLLTRKEYEQFIKEEVGDTCLLCASEEQIVLGSSDHWLWIACIAPYWKFHTMLTPKRHVESFENLAETELSDFQAFHADILKHLSGLKLQHPSGKYIDQYLLMLRTRLEGVADGSTYFKPKHLHFHLLPDVEGTERFNLDPNAHEVDILSIALPA